MAGQPVGVACLPNCTKSSISSKSSVFVKVDVPVRKVFPDNRVGRQERGKGKNWRIDEK